MSTWKSTTHGIRTILTVSIYYQQILPTKAQFSLVGSIFIFHSFLNGTCLQWMQYDMIWQFSVCWKWSTAKPDPCAATWPLDQKCPLLLSDHLSMWYHYINFSFFHWNHFMWPLVRKCTLTGFREWVTDIEQVRNGSPSRFKWIPQMAVCLMKLLNRWV